MGVTVICYVYIYIYIYIYVCVCVYIYIMLCTDYVQIPENPLSSHAFLCTRKYGFVFKKNILNNSRNFKYQNCPMTVYWDICDLQC